MCSDFFFKILVDPSANRLARDDVYYYIVGQEKRVRVDYYCLYFSTCDVVNSWVLPAVFEESTRLIG